MSRLMKKLLAPPLFPESYLPYRITYLFAKDAVKAKFPKKEELWSNRNLTGASSRQGA